MGRYIVGRLVQAVALVVVVTMVAFALVQAAPGGPAILADPNLSRAEIERMRETLGLNDPLPVQYARWMGHLLSGNLGVSYSLSRPVLDLILERLPATLMLSVAALALSLLVAIPLGVLSAMRRYSLIDYVATVFTFFGLCVPAFWYGLMLIIVFAVYLRWLPSGGLYEAGGEGGPLDRLRHLILPTVVLGTFAMAQITRYTRSSVINVLKEDYVRTARAKGLAERLVMGRHALRNALIPVVTVVGLLIPQLLGGAAITETVFSWPGMGRLAVDAAFQRDYPLIMGVTLFVSVVVVIANLVTDLTYAVLDPRIRLG